MSRILDVFARHQAKATFFWLGWIAERHKDLVRRCAKEGHEVASHGYSHLLPYQIGEEEFFTDVLRAKQVLENVIDQEVAGFRAPGFGILSTTTWAFDTIRRAGYLYDASVFPSHRGHGGIADAPLIPGFLETKYGILFEVPNSVVELGGRRMCLFGGGYLRLAPKPMLQWGLHRLEAKGRPLVVYLHPRDIDPGQPRLPLPLVRYFKSYVNLHTTLDKVTWLCEHCHFGRMRDLMELHSNQPSPDGSAGIPYWIKPGTALGVYRTVS